ncbi:hypothetical protein [Vibrio zhanjiangensis]|uniref:hypothetical protein n=1 Tax=Vibrio zhanjiangensis TaxID=1046128 RepID=UPI0024E0D3F1|nr:hypothetical protein [Vibrio zhanjiangensis]
MLAVRVKGTIPNLMPWTNMDAVSRRHFGVAGWTSDHFLLLENIHCLINPSERRAVARLR